MTKGKKGTGPKSKKTVEIVVEEQTTEPASSLSTTSSTSSDSLSQVNIIGQEEDEEGMDIFDLIYDSDQESVEEEGALEQELEYLKRKTLVEQPDFFLCLGGVPSLDDISEDISVKISFIDNKEQTQRQFNKDVGRFVDPITGEVLDDESEGSAMEEVEEEAESEPEEPLEVSELSILSLPESVTEPEELEGRDIDDTLEIFLELEKEPVEVATTDIDFEALLIEEENQRIMNNTLDFITDLINKVVEIVEYVSPEKLLEQNLDKRKLLLEISEVLPTLNIERSCCEFLNRQVGTHFRHRRSTKSSTPKSVDRDKHKFDKARKRLDKVLAGEKKLLNSSTSLRDGLQQQYNDLKKCVDNLADDFENLVRKNLYRDNRPKLNMVIEGFLMIMRTFRKEVSNVRFVLILNQHTEAQLKQLMAQLEDLGDGLTVREFNNLQAETQALDKKIEERNNDLNKLHARCRSHLHALSHYKEKHQMGTDSVTLQKATLQQLIQKKRNLREYVYNLKTEHSQLTGEIKRLSAQCGILDKPALMMDYDETVERCEEQQALNDYLKRTLAGIERKLQNLLKQNDCHV